MREETNEDLYERYIFAFEELIDTMSLAVDMACTNRGIDSGAWGVLGLPLSEPSSRITLADYFYAAGGNLSDFPAKRIYEVYDYVPDNSELIRKMEQYILMLCNIWEANLKNKGIFSSLPPVHENDLLIWDNDDESAEAFLDTACELRDSMNVGKILSYVKDGVPLEDLLA